MFSLHEIAGLLHTSLECPDSKRMVTGFSIDTRTLQKNDLFVALPGEKTDGHAFLKTAFAQGASGAVVLKKMLPELAGKGSSPQAPFINLIPVSNCEEALQRIAQVHRLEYFIPAIGVTGSVGKTTTKEFLAYLLGKRFCVLSNRGNFNNHLGLPLTLLRLNSGHEVCVCELGANHAGEIDFLSGLLRPQIAVITRIAPCHLKGFGSLENIYRAKTEIFNHMTKDATVILPDDDPDLLQCTRSKKLNIIRVGESRGAEFCLDSVKHLEGVTSFRVKKKYRFSFFSPASFLARNAAMALAAAEAAGLSLADLPSQWDDYQMPQGRFEERKIGQDVRLIWDGFNASPAAFRSALEVFGQIRCAGRRGVIFADMLELGDEETRYHRELAHDLNQNKFDFILGYGQNAKTTVETLKNELAFENAHHFEQAEDVVSYLKDRIRPGDLLLLKASRGMRMEKVAEGLERLTAGNTSVGQGADSCHH
ncbi:MAG: hypothetical protein A2Z83_00560 [Omnitrophica bacterium GWA2_52_8]|nr:MAG: hypothetical protein A2Z83_00560 [Omnitrophica bacterium GWA2_52_8]